MLRFVAGSAPIDSVVGGSGGERAEGLEGGRDFMAQLSASDRSGQGPAVPGLEEHVPFHEHFCGVTADVTVQLHSAYEGFPSALTVRYEKLNLSRSIVSSFETLFQRMARAGCICTAHSAPGLRSWGVVSTFSMAAFHSGRRSMSVISSKTASGSASSWPQALLWISRTVRLPTGWHPARRRASPGGFALGRYGFCPSGRWRSPRSSASRTAAP